MARGKAQKTLVLAAQSQASNKNEKGRGKKKKSRLSFDSPFACFTFSLLKQAELIPCAVRKCQMPARGERRRLFPHLAAAAFEIGLSPLWGCTFSGIFIPEKIRNI